MEERRYDIDKRVNASRRSICVCGSWKLPRPRRNTMIVDEGAMVYGDRAATARQTSNS